MKGNRRERPSALAHKRFAAAQEQLRGLDLKSTFTHIYRTNLWGSTDSVSGLGSTFIETDQLRREIPKLLRELGASSMLDLPCGDFGWMSRIIEQLDQPFRYIGADIVEDLVKQHKIRYDTGNGTLNFLRLDLTADPLPQADVVFCRDCLVHLSFLNIFRALANIKRSGSKYLLTTTFLEHDANQDIPDGDWRLLNFRLSPFYFPEPLATIVEGCTEGGGFYADKALCLWRVEDLPGSRPSESLPPA